MYMYVGKLEGYVNIVVKFSPFVYLTNLASEKEKKRLNGLEILYGRNL